MKTIMPPSSSSLFHFTRKWSIFKKILSKGLMYFESIEYCPNDDALSKVVYKNNGIFIIQIWTNVTYDSSISSVLVKCFK